jgi:hypothetical protein
MDDITEQLTHLARDYWQQVPDDVEAGGVQTEVVVRVGSPAEEILDYAET